MGEKRRRKAPPLPFGFAQDRFRGELQTAKSSDTKKVGHDAPPFLFCDDATERLRALGAEPLVRCYCTVRVEVAEC